MPSRYNIVVVNLGVQEIRFQDPTSPDNVPEYVLIGGKRISPELAELLGVKVGLRFTAEAISRLLRQDYNGHRTRLRFPIFAPAFRAVAQHAGSQIALVVLLATDQPETSRFYADDTIGVAELFRLVLEIEQPRLRVEIVKIRESPHLLRSALGDVRTAMDSLIPRVGPYRIYLSISPGIPAINYALLWHCLQHHGSRVFCYQVEEPSETTLRAGAESARVELFSAEAFLGDVALTSIKRMLDRCDYAGAGILLEDLRDHLPEGADVIRDLFSSAEHRLALDFIGARDKARLACRQPEFQPFEQALSDDSEIAQMAELVTVIEVRLREGYYSDAVWRLRAFHEWATEWLAKTNASTCDTPLWSLVKKQCRMLGRLIDLRNEQIHGHGAVTGEILDRHLPPELRPATEKLPPFLWSLVRDLAGEAGVSYKTCDYAALNRSIVDFLERELRASKAQTVVVNQQLAT